VALRPRDQQDLYALAEYYDIAFDFRDLDRECNALDALSVRHRGAKPVSFVDIACGPGYHCIQYALRGKVCHALDLNPAMIEYAKHKAEHAGADIRFQVADMRDFALPKPVDLAFCGISTIHYMLTNDDLVMHLRAVARNLTPGGLYVFEANHPRDQFGVGSSTKNEWESKRGDITVRMSWGLDDLNFDPITQIADSTVRIEVDRGGRTETHDFTNVDRTYTHQEFLLLIEKSGVFDICEWLGALDPSVPLDNSKASWRMIPILRRK